jgi:hypothetical protein
MLQAPRLERRVINSYHTNMFRTSFVSFNSPATCWSFRHDAALLDNRDTNFRGIVLSSHRVVLTSCCSHIVLPSHRVVLTSCCPHIVLFSHRVALTSCCPHLVFSSHRSVLTSFCPHIVLSSHRVVLTSFCPHIVFSSHRVVLTSFCLHIVLSSHRVVLTSCCPHIVLSSHRVVLTSFCPHIVLSSHRFVLTSFCPHIVLSSHRFVLTSCCPHITKEWNPRQHRCSNLKTCVALMFMSWLLHYDILQSDRWVQFLVSAYQTAQFGCSPLWNNSEFLPVVLDCATFLVWPLQPF